MISFSSFNNPKIESGNGIAKKIQESSKQKRRERKREELSYLGSDKREEIGRDGLVRFWSSLSFSPF